MKKLKVCFKWQGSFTELACARIYFGAADDDVLVSARMLQHCVAALCSEFDNPKAVMIHEPSTNAEISPKPGSKRPWSPDAATLAAWKTLRDLPPETNTVVLLVSRYSLKTLLLGFLPLQLVDEAIKFQITHDPRSQRLAEEERRSSSWDDYTVGWHYDEDITEYLGGKNPELKTKAIKLLLTDPHVARAAVKQTLSMYKYLSEKLRSNVDVVASACSSSVPRWILKYAPHSIQNNKQIIMDVRGMDHASAEIKSDKTFVMQYIAQHPSGCMCLPVIAQELQDDPEVLLAAVIKAQLRQEPINALGMLGGVSQRLMSNKSFALQVLQRQGDLLKYASAEIQADKLLVLSAVSQDGLALQYASAELRKDKEVVLVAVANNGFALRHAHARLRNNYAVVSTAIANNSRALMFASKRLCRCPSLAFEAAARDGKGFAASNTRKRSRKTLFAALSSTQSMGTKITKKLLICTSRADDYVVVAAAIEQAPQCLDIAAFEHRANKPLVLRAVSKNGMVLKHATSKMQNDRDVVLAAVRQNGSALAFASKLLRDDDEVCMVAVTQSGYALQYASAAIQASLKHVHAALSSPDQYSNSLSRVHQDLVQHKHIALAAVRANGQNLQHAVDAHRADWEVVHAAGVQDVDALKYALPECIMSRVGVGVFAVE